MNGQNKEQNMLHKDLNIDGRRKRANRTVKSALHRVGWNSGLAHTEINVRGSTLLAWLFSEANNKGLQLKEMAAKIGVTYGYVHQLRTGLKPVPGLSEEVIDNCATFLCVPRIAVLVAADIVRAEDLYAESDCVRTYLQPALRFIRHDPRWGGLMHPTVFEADEKIQQLIILLYEEATNRKLIPTRVNEEELIDAMTAKDIEGYKTSEFSPIPDGTSRH
jgi:hypothetical protein